MDRDLLDQDLRRGETLLTYADRGEGFSATRHRRYFWVHPYTRTLYWSEQNPTAGNRDAVKAKSVAIESVEVDPPEPGEPPLLRIEIKVGK